jgi:hypothetical protein
MVADVPPAYIAKAPAAVTCEMRVEGTIYGPGGPSRGPGRPAPTPAASREDAVRGPFWLGAGRVDFAWKPHGYKLPVFLKAGHRATLEIEAGHREWARLDYGRSDVRAAFSACPAGTQRRDAKGTIAVTMWAGGVSTTAPHCVRLRVTVDGKRRQDMRLALGRPCR